MIQTPPDESPSSPPHPVGPANPPVKREARFDELCLQSDAPRENGLLRSIWQHHTFTAEETEGLSVPGETDARLVTSPNSIMTVNSLGLRILLVTCCVSVATTQNYMGIGFKALDRPSFCVTPTEEQGVCVSLNSCSDLLDLLRARPIRPDVAQFLRDSQCGFEGNYPKEVFKRNTMVKIDVQTIIWSKDNRYLGVMLYERCGFMIQVESACGRAMPK
uniref:Clip domain-containing protein n=1 Tax=Timema shepardi TaxID=629360 RepID=A0A7R9FX03_TIMSH|nr:unnamed protein product [Timema shepardi]